MMESAAALGTKLTEKTPPAAAAAAQSIQQLLNVLLNKSRVMAGILEIQTAARFVTTHHTITSPRRCDDDGDAIAVKVF
jgi:hypothetical protein